MKHLGIQAMNHWQDFWSLFVVCGGFFRLILVKGLLVFSSAATMKGLVALDLWRKFQMVELTEVIRQRGDFECDFACLLN